MPAPIYTAVTGGAVALTATTAKTVIGWKAHANSGLLLRKLSVTFDGVTAANVPALVEVMYSTWASNSPGTNSTSVTPLQDAGRVLTVGATAGKTWTTEPTVLATLREWLVPPTSGLLYDWPLGDEPDCALGEGFVIRCTAPNNVSVRASMSVCRC